MAWLYVLLFVLAIVAAAVAWNAINLAHYYREAKKMRLPITIHYVANGAPLWMMFSPLIMRIAELLPFTDAFVAKYRRGWQARERCRPHLELGDLFIICTPSGNWVKVGSAELASEILKRKDDFGRDMEAFKVLDIYGKSLATSEGADWNRHRKVSAITFTEKNNELVWKESLKEASQMLEYWVKRSPQPVRTLSEDARVFTLNVLASALFGKSYDFESQTESKLREQKSGRDVASGYRDSISTILTMIVPILVFGEKVLREAWWLPSSFQKAGFAVADFRNYVTDLINEERSLISQKRQTTPNLVTNLVRACEEDEDGTVHTGDSKPRKAILTKDEIVADLFVFAFAGNDTTAISLVHLIAYMAAHPEIQDWLSEEIRHYTSSADYTTWDYQTCAKLNRCWAVMYETLRICHPISQFVKTTKDRPQTVTFNNHTFTIPPRTAVEINVSAIQTHPRYWGTESNLTWNPKRFITGSNLAEETLGSDTGEAFFPWAFGRLICPGRRFSQAELVAVLAAIFRDYRLEPALEPGETILDARRRAVKLAEDVEQTLLTEMRQPEKLGLRWTVREDAKL